MMARISLLLTAALFAPVAFADEAEPQRKGRRTTVKQLLDRIEQLERRVAELESERLPEVQTRLVPVQPTPHPSLGGATAPEVSVPGSWGRFQFNGQWYFIVPAGDVAIRSTAGRAARPGRSGRDATANDRTPLSETERPRTDDQTPLTAPSLVPPLRPTVPPPTTAPRSY